MTPRIASQAFQLPGSPHNYSWCARFKASTGTSKGSSQALRSIHWGLEGWKVTIELGQAERNDKACGLGKEPRIRGERKELQALVCVIIYYHEVRQRRRLLEVELGRNLTKKQLPHFTEGETETLSLREPKVLASYVKSIPWGWASV